MALLVPPPGSNDPCFREIVVEYRVVERKIRFDEPSVRGGDLAGPLRPLVVPAVDGGVVAVPRRKSSICSPEEPATTRAFSAPVAAQDAGRSVEESHRGVAAAFGVTRAQVRTIEKEGLAAGWPPLDE